VVTGTYALVAWGVVAALLLGLGMAFDLTALIILGFIALTGWMAIGVARKMRAGSVGPRTCPHCGGLVAPSAPYCKHCLARL
jgi:hypothetical protein